MIHAAKQLSEVFTKHNWERPWWWWNDNAQNCVSFRKNVIKWKAGESTDSYQAFECASNLAAHLARNEAEEGGFKKVILRSVETY